MYTYPDVTIVCDEPKFEDNTFDTLVNPRVIAEVLSDSTETYDRGRKFAHYQRAPSIQEYVLVSQNLPLVERFVRQTDESWQYKAFNGIDQAFEFQTVVVRVALAEIYRGVSFSSSPRDSAQ